MHETRVSHKNFLGYVPFKWPPRNGFMKFKMRKLDNNNFDHEYDILVLGVTSSSSLKEQKMPFIRTKNNDNQIKYFTSSANSKTNAIVHHPLVGTDYHEVQFKYKDNDGDDRTKLEVFFDGVVIGNVVIEIVQKDNVEIYASYDGEQENYDSPATNILIKDLEFGED